jgi:hypothetical protein
MADGSLKNIEDIKTGDYVLAYNINKQKNVPTLVTKTFDLIREGVYEINDGILLVTCDHPLYVMKPSGEYTWAAIDPDLSKSSYGYRDAVKLEVGDVLFTLDGKGVKVEKIEYYPGSVNVYSFSVLSESHNYFANKVLASNSKYVLEDNDQSENSVSSMSYVLYDCRKIDRFSDIPANRLKEMFDLPDGVDFNVKIYENGYSSPVLDYPQVSYDDVESTMVISNKLVYHLSDGVSSAYINTAVQVITVYGSP